MGQADYLALGDHNAVCYECGAKFKFSQLRKHWQGYYVCPQHWEPRQPQDFVRGVPDNQTVAVSQPWPAVDTFIGICTINGSSAIPSYATPACMIPSRTTIVPM